MPLLGCLSAWLSCRCDTHVTDNMLFIIVFGAVSWHKKVLSKLKKTKNKTNLELFSFPLHENIKSFLKFYSLVLFVLMLALTLITTDCGKSHRPFQYSGFSVEEELCNTFTVIMPLASCYEELWGEWGALHSPHSVSWPRTSRARSQLTNYEKHWTALWHYDTDAHHQAGTGS